MSGGQDDGRRRRSRLLMRLVAAGLALALGGCVVVPAYGPFYRPRPVYVVP